ncbi:MAG TPA: VWA domain-containing protein [Thermoanaerobaculia bacterium]|nr:VWA domain-containing protein [Thermoanaerobaculia bacterium]
MPRFHSRALIRRAGLRDWASSSLTRWLAPALGLILLAVPANAQRDSSQRDPAQLETFEDRANVLEVQVPVNVVGKDGHPVRGLTVDDFEIVDEGKRREVTSFEVIDLEELSVDPARPSLAEEAIPGAARRHFLFLFDLSFSRGTHVLRARQAAQRFVVESMHPTDLAAVATHSVETGPRLIVTFTPDRAQLARAIDTLGAPTLLKDVRDPLRFVIDTPDADSGLARSDASSESPIGEFETVSTYLSVIGNQMQRMEKAYVRGQVTAWTQSLGEMAKILASVEGRKHVVYFTEGFDGRLVFGRQPDKDDPEGEADYFNIQRGQYHLVDLDDTFGNTQLQNNIMLMLGEFRRADSVLQVVDISGIRADLPAEHRARRVNDEVLFMLANETGGELFEGSNDFGRQLEGVLDRSTVTYLLSFNANDLEADGSHRKLKVRVNAPRGSRVSHREGYYSPRPFEQLHPLEKSLLASDLIASAAPKDDLRMNVLAASFRATEERAYVPVIVEVDGADLLAGHEKELLPIEFYGYVTDAEGEMKDFFTQLVTLDLRNREEVFAASGVKYYGHLDLAPGKYLIRVLARNAITGRTGVETLDVDVPPYDDQAPQLLPPFFLEEPGTWFLVREQTSEYAKSTIYPFTVNGEPYVPAAKPALVDDRGAQLCLVAYNLSESDLELAGTVIDKDGSEVSGGRLRLDERTVTGIQGLDKLTATFRPNGLAAGDYRLQVTLTDLGTQSSQVTSIPFSVRESGAI